MIDLLCHRRRVVSLGLGGIVTAALLIVAIGCSREQTQETLSSAPLPKSPDLAGVADGGPAGEPLSNSDEVNALSGQPNLAEPPIAWAGTPNSAKPLDAANDSGPFVAPVDPLDPPTRPELPKLRADLPPQKLVEFLAAADLEMQQIYSGAAGVRNNDDALVRMRQIGKLKLEAAKRLREHADATEEQASEGSRGELQALSHLAALGDLRSAETLETLATENLSSDDPQLVTDSRLVLIGFAIESLQHGKKNAPDKIIDLVNGLVRSSSKPDVPAMMVMGQARQMLAQYGHDEQAGLVRQVILDLFSGADDPQVAKMAAQLAGSVRFDTIDRTLELAINGDEVSVTQWKEAAETLTKESSDIMTVQYLAGAALEFEASGRDDLAQATYDLLRDQYGDRSDAIGDETAIAIDARDARRSVIGLTFDPALSQIDGSPLPMSRFHGKVVLMPFWATGFPQSLQILPLLQEIRDTDPDRIEIVGMNLDREGTPVADFMREHKLDFLSYQSVSSPTAKVANPVASRFGMVSMPFVAVLDQEGRVVALDFKGLILKRIVDDLLRQ